MKNKVWIFALILCCMSIHVSAQVKPVVKEEKTIKLFFEKTYLHIDRTYYSSGEDIWFSAYLVNGKSTGLTNTSNNLYVELLNPNGKLVERKLIRLDGGLGKGDFKLKDTLETGWYNISAYTNWMHNFGDNFVFKTKIHVTNVVADKDLKSAKVGAKKVERVNSSSPKKTITFFPEGGSLIEGLTSLVAFKTNDELGNGLKTSGSIVSSKGDTISTFESTAIGMGSFTFTPAANEDYKVVGFYGSEKFSSALPKALKSGLSMHITTDSLNIKASITANEVAFNNFKGKPISMVIKHAGDVVYSGTITLTKTTSSVSIPTKDLPAGVAVFTLIDHLGRPNCERLIYIQSANKVNFSVHSTKSTYKNREKVTLNVKATDVFGKPIKTYLSLAAVDGLLPSDSSNIVNYLMLQSELKGDIKNAAQYFNSDNTGRFKQLDLLLLTQGWREYLWRKLADSAIRISYMPEPGISIKGSVTEKLSNKPMPNMNITLFGSEFTESKLYFTKTDAGGNYYLDGLKWNGNKAIKLISKNNKNENKGWIKIDSIFNPIPFSVKKFAPIELPVAIKEEIVKRSTYNRRFKIGDSIMLDEVTITGNKYEKVSLFEETLNTFGYPDQVFNITAADYEYKGLVHFLSIKANAANDGTDSAGNEVVTFGTAGRPRVIVNDQQDLQDRIDYFTLTMDQINKIRIRHLIDGGGKDVFVLYLYVKDTALQGPNLYLLNLNLNGYYTARKFYSPNYTSNPLTFRDLRTTIFWEPALQTNDKGEASVSFYTGDNKGNVNIQTNGISASGTAFSSHTTFKVQ
ncbi:MAG: hypothetical protein EOP00_07450 [Pedobacter sp.]|nr:MAG: hypothetical protein EOP00_07450 [Pedobacter sp.]